MFKKNPPIQKKTATAVEKEICSSSFLLSQVILLQSRKKWGIIFALATVTGILCTNPGIFVMGIFDASQRGQEDEVIVWIFVSKLILLPLATFLTIVGMYVLNDLFDVDIDRANGKKRPIPLRLVSKNQVWIFVALTNAIGFAIALFTYSLPNILIFLSLVAIGLMYSSPKVSLKDRLVIKTLSISIALVLCLLFGLTGIYNWTSDGKSLDELAVPLYAALMLGIMIFVTSPLNDLGDINGDRGAGRRTIPIVIGRKRTLKLSVFFSSTMIVLSWIFYCYSTSKIGIIIPLLTSLHATLTILTMGKMLANLDNMVFVRRFVLRKSMPLHILLQLLLIVGALLSKIVIG
jgi:geranylgeranylglycerol-phosphate geranylgeranyltransferase